MKKIICLLQILFIAASLYAQDGIQKDELILENVYDVWELSSEELSNLIDETSSDAVSEKAFRYYLGYGGLPIDYVEAFELFQSIENSGDPIALFGLAVMYNNGEGVQKNKTKANEYFNIVLSNLKARAYSGDAISQFCLGIYYGQDDESTMDLKSAFEWLCKSAEQGYPPAQFFAGTFYYNGCWVKKDYNAAFQLFSNAAEHDFIIADYLLGDCYSYGQGVRKDCKTAFEFYSNAAEWGYPPAMTSLGHCYLNGLGVKEDSNMAIEYYKQAADLGDVEAIHTLSNMEREIK